LSPTPPPAGAAGEGRLAALRVLVDGWPQLQELRLAAVANATSCHDRRRHAASSLAACSRAEMTAALELDEAGREIVVVVPDTIDDEGRQLLQVLRQRYIPSRVLVWSRAGTTASLPLQQGRGAVDGKVTIYVCEGGACQLPVTTSRALLEVLSRRV
jgi:uncharacterized protein YyaL (SSP411 family)